LRRWDLRLSERLTKCLGYASQRINAHWQRNGVVIYRFYEYIRHRKQAHQRRLRTRLLLQRSVLRSASASSRPHAAVSQANSPCIHSLAFSGASCPGTTACTSSWKTWDCLGNGRHVFLIVQAQLQHQASSAIWRETADHIVARDDEHMLHSISRVIHRDLPHFHSRLSLSPSLSNFICLHACRLLQWCRVFQAFQRSSTRSTPTPLFVAAKSV